jgi:hypothetical protein
MGCSRPLRVAREMSMPTNPSSGCPFLTGAKALRKVPHLSV